MKRHHAGKDLSGDLKAAPHGPDVLDKFPVIGRFKPCAAAPKSDSRASVEAWLDKNPFFRRHPHPALVHFPVALFVLAPVFEIIGLVFQSPATEWAAVLVLSAGVLSLPAVMASGYFAWWINYDCSDFDIIKVKRHLAWGIAASTSFALVLRVFMADPLNFGNRLTLLYIGALVLTGVMTSLVGFLGGKLTFPYE